MLNLDKYGFRVEARAPAIEVDASSRIYGALSKAFSGIRVVKTSVPNKNDAFVVSYSDDCRFVFSYVTVNDVTRIVAIGTLKYDTKGRTFFGTNEGPNFSRSASSKVGHEAEGVDLVVSDCVNWLKQRPWHRGAQLFLRRIGEINA